jgi:release factor glutamine methyltransferase
MEQLDLYTELSSLLSEKFKPLRDKPEETIDSTLRALWFAAFGESKSPEMTNNVTLPVLNPDAVSVLRGMVDMRLSGIPLSYITKRQRFCNLDFEISPEAMIPRKETELLVRHALKLIESRIEDGNNAIVIDTCTGSGNIALSIAYYKKRTVVYANDISDKAIDVCRRNALHLNITEGVTFLTGDLLTPFLNDIELKGKVDIITCNPPYISTNKLTSLPPEIIQYEPKQAFDGGAFGISILTRIQKEAPLILKNTGYLCIEVGEGQGPAVLKKFKIDSQWDKVEGIRDNSGVIRVISARKK